MATAAVMTRPCSPVVSTSPVLSMMPQEQTQRCRSCQSDELYVDWSQGDRICTSCGVVDEGNLLDDRPEWREFNDDNDLAKNGKSGARSGLVVVDDARYLGGLQPTTLSKQVFGGSTANSNMTRKRLLAANHRLDRTMEKMHAQSLKTAKLSHRARKRKTNLQDNEESDIDTDMDNSVRPEYEQMLIQEEEDAHRVQAALQADKWSLQRAIRLFAPSSDQVSTNLNNQEEEIEDLNKRLSAPLKRASQDLYTAYAMLLAAAQTLHLPDRVSNEATTMLCRYASRRDGITVRGVASTLKRKSKANVSKQEEEAAKEALRDYNKTKQMGSLCAALLFFTARNLGWPRSLVEVCESIQPTNLSGQHLEAGKDQFIKRKHCSRAMTEVRELFPDYARPVAVASGAIRTIEGSNDSAITNFAEHAIRKLDLPPVAEACVRLLVLHHRKEQDSMDTSNGKRLPTICASMTYFISAAGEIMQRLALQATQAGKRRTVPAPSAAPPTKKIKIEDARNPDRTKQSVEHVKQEEVKVEDVQQEGAATDNTPGTKHDDVELLPDVISLEDDGHDIAAEQRAYEMRRMWDAWAEQMPWSRSVALVESSCGVSRNLFLEYYKANIYPQRHALLNVLREAVSSVDTRTDELAHESITLTETPLASVLLPHIVTAAPLMKNDAKF
jgi:transcription initiation factor TFIIIB Brf1 subunit/transcription initiation factor TFIIB